MRFGRLKNLTRPTDACLVHLRFAPASVNIHDKVRTSLRKCGGINSNTTGGPADVANEYLTFRSGQFTHRID